MSVFDIFKKKRTEQLQNKEDYNTDPLWYVKILYRNNFNVSRDGNVATVHDNNFEGVCNNIDLISYVEDKGWTFITVSVTTFDDCMPLGEYIFRKRLR